MTEEDPLVGTVIDGRYEVERLIGKGGFSSVYRGRALEDDRSVAIKVLLLGPDTEAASIERFSREAQIVANLESPNTVRIYDWGQVGTDLLYTVMEYIEGRSLSRQIRRHGALNSRQVAEVTIQICDSVIEVHEQGYLHRDLKPSNVMLYRDDEGHVVVKVLDFGVVKILDPSAQYALRITHQGTFVGTPRYASPEQLRRVPLTPASDVYAVGMIMWETLVGDPAVGDKDYSECVKAHLGPDPWLVPKWVDCSPNFAAVVEKALAKPVDQRYQSCVELRAALHDWLMSRSSDSHERSPKSTGPSPDDSTSTPPNGGRTMAKKDKYQAESLEDVEAEDELFGEMVEESDAHIEDVNVMAASDLSEASDANQDRSHITVATKRKSQHAGIEPDDRPVTSTKPPTGQSNPLLLVLLLAAVVVGGLFLFTAGTEEDVTDDTSAKATAEKTDETPPAAADEEPEEKKPVAPDSEMGDGTPTLDADTLAKGMVASGWKVGARQTDKMDEVLQTTVVATKDNSAATVTIYESETWEWAEKLRKETEKPAQAIAFGRTIVRVTGGPGEKLNGTLEMTDALYEFKKHARARARGEADEGTDEEAAETAEEGAAETAEDGAEEAAEDGSDEAPSK